MSADAEVPADVPAAEAPAPATESVAWVLHADDPRAVRRTARIVAPAAEHTVPLDTWTVCLEGPGLTRALDAPKGGALRLQVRAERRLGAPIEFRATCTAAWAPAGTGFLLLTVGQPAPALDAVLEEVAPTYRDVRVPSDPEEPVRVCVPLLAVPDPSGLEALFQRAGLELHEVYEVGGCRR